MDNETIISKVKEEVTTYIELKAEWVKLTTYEKVAKTTAILSHCIIMLFVIFFTVFFLFFSLAFLLGEILNSIWSGFMLIFLVCTLILLPIVFFRRKIRNSIVNMIIKALREDDKEAQE